MLLDSWPAPLRSLLFSLLGVNWAARFLAENSRDHPSRHELLNRIFRRNNFDVRVAGDGVIPTDRGCVFVINHPHGLFDGLGAIWVASSKGHDCRAIGRHFLSVFKPIEDWFLFVKIDQRRNAEAVRQITEQSAQFLQQGGSLVVTPAGRLGVSRPLNKPARDLPWKAGAVRMARAAQAPLVLLHIDINHSVIRQLGQRVHGVVRALLQVWAYRFGRSQKLHIRVLAVLESNELPAGTAKEQTAWLQKRYDDLVADSRE